MDQDHYAVLGLGRHATSDEIKEAYRRLVRMHHPDANPHRREESETVIKSVFAAYSVLSDPDKRQRYDWDLQTAANNGIPSPPPPSAQTESRHRVYVHPQVTISFLGRVREANNLTMEEMAHRLGLSEEALKGMESRDTMPSSPVQLRTVTYLTEQAVKSLESRGRTSDAEALRTTFNRKKNARAIFR